MQEWACSLQADRVGSQNQLLATSSSDTKCKNNSGVHVRGSSLIHTIIHYIIIGSFIFDNNLFLPKQCKCTCTCVCTHLDAALEHSTLVDAGPRHPLGGESLCQLAFPGDEYHAPPATDPL